MILSLNSKYTVADYLLKKKNLEVYFQRCQMDFGRQKQIFIFTKDPIKGCARTFKSAKEAREYNREQELNLCVVPKPISKRNTEPYLHY